MKSILANIIQKSNNITRHLTEARKIMSVSSIIITSAFIIMSLSFTNIIPTANTHAESFQSSEQLQFTLNPTISISISGNLTIENLTPGDSKDSNVITITASSNASAGYNLTSTVGTTNNASNELRKDGANTTNKFTNLTSNQSTLAGFNDNEWGYSYSLCATPECAEEPAWISGSIGSTLAGYDGYDYNTTTSTSETITHLVTSTSGTSAIKYKIGAKSSPTQLAGEYTNAINFIGITNPNPTYITLDEATYMQDSFSCTATKYGTVKSLIDNRDNQSYLVAKANDGNCWMIENLKLGKTLTSGQSLTLTSSSSDVTDNFIMNYTDIPTDSKFHAYTVDEIPYQNNSNEWICRGGENDWDSCYYNWYTATAGAGTTATTSGSVDTSLCPAGWSLPTQPQFSSLYNQYPSAALMEVDNPTTTKDNFAGKIPGFLFSGNYGTDGTFGLGSRGFYWSRTAYSAQRAWHLYMNPSSVSPENYGTGKYTGFAVRCIAQ